MSLIQMKKALYYFALRKAKRIHDLLLQNRTINTVILLHLPILKIFKRNSNETENKQIFYISFYCCNNTFVSRFNIINIPNIVYDLNYLTAFGVMLKSLLIALFILTYSFVLVAIVRVCSIRFINSTRKFYLNYLLVLWMLVTDTL